MAKLTKRFLLCFMTLVLLTGMLAMAAYATADPIDEPECYVHGDLNGDGVVDNQDAVYLLYHILFGEDRYHVSQDCDFNGDGAVNSEDVLYLLYASMGVEGYSLKGIIHDYYAPTWSWTEDSEAESGYAAVASFTCGCKEGNAQVTEGVVIHATVETAPSCTQLGQKKLTATVTFGGESFTSPEKLVAMDALGHELTYVDADGNPAQPGCDNGQKCTREGCGYTVAAVGHIWQAGQVQEATCDNNVVTTNYSCTTCGETKTDQVPGTADHNYIFDRNEPYDTEPCTFVKMYKCSGCGKELQGQNEKGEPETFVQHTYTVALTKEITCTTGGEKTYTCSVPGCGNTYTETAVQDTSLKADPARHTWNEGVTESGVTTYTCTQEDCGATKTAVTADDDGTVSAEQLAADTQVELDENKTSVSLDQATLEGLGTDRDIQITVDTVDKEKLPLAQDKLEQIGDNTVYDFNMTYAGTNKKVTNFEGKVTVSLPYTLEAGEDIDAIDVWYVDDEGNLTQVFATYSNGFITFETNHFSYYTVTRLTAVERCGRYGHIEVTSESAASCSRNGYVLTYCQRCAAQLKKQEISASGHNYVDTVNAKAPTCTEAGKMEKQCTHCEHVVSGTIPATGHKMQSSEKSAEATCQAPGQTVTVCATCSHEQVVAIPQKQHTWALIESVAASCTVGGYDAYACGVCGQTERRNEVAPLGHAFMAAGSEWAWAEDNLSATLTLYCQHDRSHTKVVDAAVAVTVSASGEEGASACVTGTVTDYVATVSLNGVTYQDVRQTSQAAQGHQLSGLWEHDDAAHYQTCSVCKLPQNVTRHSWDSVHITQAATCTQEGKRTVSCSVCGVSREETVPATALHTYENGRCTVCDRLEGTCNHKVLSDTVIKLDGYGICEGATLIKTSCPCGEVVYYALDSLGCTLEDNGTTEEIDEIGNPYEYTRLKCSTCGLEAEGSSRYVYTEDPCLLYVAESLKLTKDGTVIVQSSRTLQPGAKHPYMVITETIELTQEEHGVCGLVLEITECPCGEAVTCYMPLDRRACQMEGQYDEEGNYHFRCVVCGLEKRALGKSTTDLGGCSVKEVTEYGLVKDGQVLVNFSQSYLRELHQFELTDWELYGESCADGIFTVRECTACGKVLESYSTEHDLHTVQIIQMADYGACEGTLKIRKCLCGEGVTEVAHYADRCLNAWYDEDNRFCEYCGLTYTANTTYGEKDENCQLFIYRDVCYQLGDQVIYAGSTKEQRTMHDLRASFELAGETCEEGVTVTETCQDCGYAETLEVVDHYLGVVEVIDLNGAGACGGTLEHISCACGWDSWWNENLICEMNYDEELGYHICAKCGLTRTFTQQTEVLDACRTLCTDTHSYILGEEVLGTMENTYIYWDHDWETTFELNGETCADGFTLVRTCRDCGQTEQETRPTGSCDMRFVVSSETVDLDMCGEYHVMQYRCACGRNYSFDNWVENGYCMWDNYQQLDNGYSETCSVCGITQTVQHSEVGVEGMPCYTDDYITFTFSRDGEVLRTVNARRTYQRHRETVTFELFGEDCEAGYRAHYTCSVCGNTHTEENYGHSFHPVAVEVLGALPCGDVIRTSYSCACGQNGHTIIEDSCAWTWGQIEELGQYGRICQNCNAWVIQVSESSQPVEGDPCELLVSIVFDYYVNMEKAFTATEIQKQSNHDWTLTFRLLGNTCADGYYYTRSCKRCDYVGMEEGPRYDCGIFDLGRELLIENACGDGIWLVTEGCACGKERRTAVSSDCAWRYTYHEELGIYCAKCDSCGIYRVENVTFEPIPGETCLERYIRTNTFYADAESYRAGEALGAGVQTGYGYSHKMVTTFRLLGQTCADGYYYTESCILCGETYAENGPNYECRHHITGLELISDQLCGGLYKQTLTCACGALGTEIYMQSDCDRSTDEGYWTPTCQVCGITEEGNTTSSKVEGRPCEVLYSIEYTYKRGEEVICTAYAERVESNHTWLHTYRLLGQTCADGFYADKTCLLCDATETVEYDGDVCVPRLTGVRSTEEGQLCGILTIEERVCACGKQRRTDYNWSQGSCNFNSWIVVDGKWTSTCPTCGAVEFYTDTFGEVDSSDPCYLPQTRHYTIARDGVEIITYDTNYGRYEHDWQTTFALNGETCADGYYVTSSCSVCGITESDGTLHTGCTERWQIDKTVLLEGNEEGVCGRFTVYLYSCACGRNQEHRDSNACIMDWVSDGELDTYRCRNCGLERVSWFTATPNPDKGPCAKIWNETWEIRMNGQTISSHDHSYNRQDHDMICEYDMLGTTCADGYKVKEVCRRCGSFQYLNNGDIFTNHDSNLTQRIDLSEYGVHGGEIAVYACACGENSHCSVSYACTDMENDYTSTGDYRNGTDVHTSTCKECGLVDTVTNIRAIPEGVCEGDAQQIIRVQIGSLDFSHTSYSNCYDHDYDETYVLNDGSASCGDGITVYQSCTICGSETSYVTYNHYMNVAESTDLAQFGAICGGYLDFCACPCGEKSEYRLSDIGCDMSAGIPVDIWVPGALNQVSQNNSNGGSYLESYGELLRCAVTDPASCPMTIRKGVYWLHDEANCRAVKYEVWQLGYDETTGACQREIIYETGDVIQWHTFTEDNQRTDNDDGGYSVTYTQTCSYCGSTNVYVDRFNADDNRTFHSQLSENKLENGERRRYERIDEYTYIPATSQYYDSRYYYSYTEANGETYWYQVLRTLDTQSCQLTEHITSSDGRDDVTAETRHYANRTYGAEVEIYCSQQIQQPWQDICVCCGQVVQEGNNYYGVTDHSFIWDDQLQTYVCSACGLENVNGSSGNIVMADMTDSSYGDGSSYVIGYYTHGNSLFNPYVSVILYDAAEGEDELVLTGIDFTYYNRESNGIIALAFSRAAAQAAADQAIANAGYTGSYALRISFVPSDSSDTLDYAITFDSQIAE